MTINHIKAMAFLQLFGLSFTISASEYEKYFTIDSHKNIFFSELFKTLSLRKRTLEKNEASNVQ